MAWGSFVVGGLVFGVVFFFLGILLGILGAKADVANGIYKRLAKDILKDLKVGEIVHFNYMVEKRHSDDDEDDDVDCNPHPPDGEMDLSEGLDNENSEYAQKAVEEEVVDSNQWTPENN